MVIKQPATLDTHHASRTVIVSARHHGQTDAIAVPFSKIQDGGGVILLNAFLPEQIHIDVTYKPKPEPVDQTLTRQYDL
jgi:hypothetical protein